MWFFELLAGIFVAGIMNAIAPQYSRYIYTGIAILLTLEGFRILSKRLLKLFLLSFKKKVGVRMSYLIIGLLGAGLSMGYWWGIQKIFMKQTSTIVAPQVLSTPKQPPPSPEKVLPLPEQPKPLTKKDLELALDEFKKTLSNTKEITNKQICLQTMDLVKRMHKFANDRRERIYQLSKQSMDTIRDENKTEEERTQIAKKHDDLMFHLWQNDEYEFKTTILGEAIYLKDELLKRLPLEPKPNDKYPFHVFKGSLAGSNPEDEVADYLEGLARKLCPQEKYK